MTTRKKAAKKTAKRRRIPLLETIAYVNGKANANRIALEQALNRIDVIERDLIRLCFSHDELEASSALTRPVPKSPVKGRAKRKAKKS